MPTIFWIQEVLFPMLGMMMGAGVLFGAYKTLNRHLDRRHERELGSAGGAPALRRDLGELRERVEILESSERRVEELEERLDFAERVLSQGERGQTLQGGH